MNWKKACFEKIQVLITEAQQVSEACIWVPSHDLAIYLNDLDVVEGAEKAYYQANRSFTIWQDQWYHSSGKIVSMLRSILGKNQKVYARNTQILQIGKSDAQLFLEKYHLLGACKSRYNFALVYEGECVAVAAFSKPRIFVYQNKEIPSYELSRFVCKSGITIVGGLSRLLSYFVSLFKPCHLMTYVDSEWSDGENFRKLGFDRVGNTLPISFVIPKDTLLRKPLKNKTEFDKNSVYIIGNKGNIKFSCYFT